MAASRVLIVCSGNICRSPMAEVVLGALDSELVVDSAGTGGWHQGDPMDGRALEALAARGYDGAPHRARRVEPHWLAERDLVLAADRGHQRDLQRLATRIAGAAPIVLLGRFAGDARSPDIPDPYYGGPEDFDDCLALIERCCKGLVAERFGDDHR